MAHHTHILILGAMDREIDGVRRALGLHSNAAVLNVYPRWRSADGWIDLVQTHVGDVDAAIAATAAIAQRRPDVVLKLGCVGGHSAGVHAGDVITPQNIFHSGAWIARTSDAMQWTPVFGDLPFQVNRENLGGRAAVLHADAVLTDVWRGHAERAGLHVTPAHIGSSNMWFFDRAHMAHVLAANLTDVPLHEWVADMESYAIARACAAAGVPFTGIYRAANSEFHGEPYVPSAVAELFEGAFALCILQFLRDVDDRSLMTPSRNT